MQAEVVHLNERINYPQRYAAVNPRGHINNHAIASEFRAVAKRTQKKRATKASRINDAAYMTTQQEFCFLAWVELENWFQRVGSRSYLGIEHLTLGRQPITLLNQRVNLFTTLQYALNLKMYQQRPI